MILLALFASFNLMAFDFQEVNEDGQTIYYNITSASLQTVDVTYNSDDLYVGVIVIPQIVGHEGTVYSVTGISDSAFENCDGLTSVVIPESVTRVGNYAFRNCAGLTSISVPNVTVSYGINILENCTSLVSFDAPRYMTSIPEAFFKGCTSLTNVTMTTSLISISWSAFEGCVSLTSTSFSIPSSVVSIGYSAFKDCTGLTSITIPNGVVKIDNDTFKGCINLTTVNLPNTLNEIKSFAFRDCVSLEEINFPASLTRIGLQAFNGCTSLEVIDMENSGVNYIDSYAFEGCTSLNSVTFSNTLTYLGAYSFGNCTALTSLELPRSLTTVGAQSFAGCSGIETLILPSTTVSIGSEAFKGCTGITVIRCYAQIPPMAGNNDCFDGVSSSTMVYVPCSSIGAYMSMIPWSSFNIWCDPNISIVVDVQPLDKYGYVTGAGNFTTDETVRLVAVPRTNYVFSHWSENDEIISTDSIYTFTALESRNLTANFGHKFYTINAVAQPASYGRVTGAGVYEYSTVARLEAYANEHYQFYSWTENDSIVCMEPTYRFTVPYDRDLVANFEPMQYNVVTSLNIAEAGETTGDGIYVYNTSVTVTTTGNEHYNFSCWKEYGEVVSTNPVYTFNISKHRNLVAVYIPDDFEISVDVNMEEAGTVDGAGLYPYHTMATLTATPAEHYHFAFWEEDGNIVSTSATYTFLVEGNRHLTAVFDINTYTVTITSNIEGMGLLFGQGSYTAGSKVTVSTTPYIHSIFNYWTEDGEIVSSARTFSFYIDRDRSFEANFSVEDDHFWIPNNTLYPNTMMLTGVIQIDGEEMASSRYEVGAFCGEEVRGSQRAQLVNSTGRYLVYMMIYGNNGDNITFKLYDHEINEILELECVTNLTFTKDVFVGTTNAPHVLNYASELFVTTNASPANYGTVSGGGPCHYGDEITITASALPGYTFLNWTENGEVVTTNSTYSFIANSNRTFTAHFGVGNHWNPVPTPRTMDMIGVIEICGVEQRSDSLEVGAFYGDIVRGSQLPVYIESLDRYIVLMTLYGNDGEELTFKLFDHRTGVELQYIAGQTLTFMHNTCAGDISNPFVLNFAPAVNITTIAMPDFAGTVSGGGLYQVGSQVTLRATGINEYAFVNWTINGVQVSAQPVYTFTANQDVTVVAHFDHGQNTDLAVGWNWYSTYIEMNGVNGLDMIKDRLAGRCTYIRSSTQYIEYANNEWNGTLTRIVNEKMYSIYMTVNHTLSIHGIIADPNSHPINLTTGWTWIGYPVNDTLEINEALTDLEAYEGDRFKAMDCYAEYHTGTGWVGSLTTLYPGQGYMYHNMSNNAKSFIYHTNDTTSTKQGRGGNITTKDNFWQPNIHKYPSNMNVTSVIMLNDCEQRAEHLEIGAFCDGECRGSARPIYVEELDRYITFMTIYGENGDEITFRLYDALNNEIVSDYADNTLIFSSDAIVGSSTEVFEIEYNNIANASENSLNIGIYPNPGHTGEGVLIVTNTANSKAEVYNAIGTKVFESVFNDEERLSCFTQPGVYFIRVLTDEGEAYKKIVIE